MAIVRANTFEGIPIGSVLDVGSSVNGGNGFSTVTGTPTITAEAMHGSRALDCTGNGVANYATWEGIPSSLTFGYRYYLCRTATPSTGSQIMTIRNGTNYIHGNNLNAANKLQITEWGGAPNHTSTTTLALDTWYRSEGWCTVQTATTGLYVWKLFLGDSTTALETATITDADMQTTGAQIFRIGKHLTSGSLGLIVDDLAVSNTYAAIGPSADTADSRVPSSVISNPGAWTVFGGSPTLNEGCADFDDTTGARSPNDPASAVMTFGFGSLTINKPVRVQCRHSSPAGDGTISRTYTLMQGATSIAARTITLPEAIQTYTFTTTTAETAAITDWSALRVRVNDLKVP